MSWWDYGYQMAAMGNKNMGVDEKDGGISVVVDNNTWNNTHIAAVAAALVSSEDVAWRIMEHIGEKIQSPNDTTIPCSYAEGCPDRACALRLHGHMIGRLGTAKVPDVLTVLCLFPGVDYVMVVFGGSVGYAADDISKFLWPVRIAGGVFDGNKEIGGVRPRIREDDYLVGVAHPRPQTPSSNLQSQF